MPFIPHTAEDIHDMLKVLGVSCVNDLRDEIPHCLREEEIADSFIGLNEMEIIRLMKSRAESDGRYLSFLGGGAYEHYVPAAVKQTQTLAVNFPRHRSSQAQASPSMLQLMYEYQTMMASLTGLDISNEGVYDGASALAEAILMALRARKEARRILIASTINPRYRAVLRTLVGNRDIEITNIRYDIKTGQVDQNSLA